MDSFDTVNRVSLRVVCLTSDRCSCVEDDDYWTLLLLLFPLLTVFGNVLVCLSVYRERSLQTVTNYFIVSLAIADIMVAVLVMPLAVYVEVSRQHPLAEKPRDAPSYLEMSSCQNATKVDRFSIIQVHIIVGLRFLTINSSINRQKSNRLNFFLLD